MKWGLPPKIKIYEALGSIGDGRIEIEGNEGKLYSSSGNKFYSIFWEPETNTIMCNDNASFFVGYLGYPAIAFLMQKGVIRFDQKWAKALSGIPWKDINKKFKNDFEKTKEYSLDLLKEKGYNQEEFLGEVEDIYDQIVALDLNLQGKKQKPPKGY
jgi:hypothetical protein